VSDDPDLRSQLERIASSVGDPPEHGLEQVAARRRRRLRRRRGAVATAAVLAVLAVAAPLISHGLDDDRQSVTAAQTASPVGAPAEVPRRVEVRCEPTGIVVPVASVRPERDGLHIRVHNLLPDETTIDVRGESWYSGEIPVQRGVWEVRQAVPPGQLTIGCDIGGEFQHRRVDLVDPAGYYEPPELACGDEYKPLHDLPIDPADNNIFEAARQGLDAYLVDGTATDGINPQRGYPSSRVSDRTTDPVVQVERDGAVIAFAHVRGADGAVRAPWTNIEWAEVCTDMVKPGTTATTQTPTSTEPGAEAETPQ
jgi:hypothetical protein